MELKNKRIVITGAGSGIGKETVLQALKHDGVKILACDLNEENILVHPNVIPYKCDVSNKESLDKLLKDADKKLGGIDIFYANAGFAYYEVIPNADWDRIDRIYRTNVYSPLYCLIALNHTRKEPFLFIVTASAMSHLSLPGYAQYSSTKAAVRSFIDAYKYELKPGNRVMVVYPIATRTQFFDAAGKKVPVPFPSQSAETVAKQVVKGILSNAKEVYPSLLFRCMQVVNRFLFFPFPIYQKIEAGKLESLKK
ncbi:SDR family NAD(P)-dependent oxidoreductase [Leptospira vanthielii]|uniref:SDR family NAD(P)-dependent oxidoreductase n=2 Tax=Leptospira vanthielii TaxID=293085 RepID=A0ABY2NTX6_9LEPT|nr:SDR family NAD(P)-dependent oxidoreductase [Leptospira vanthielii]EMY69608.1 KR domain protein [Leptospira vanthielii serovar Holland str. Waz Holland = ATCC 700522]TGM60716.1 SDR family NAD(P)-dependent oxidoreductase [Leptospira vanthielii]